MDVSMNFKLFAVLLLVAYSLVPIIFIMNSFKVNDKNIRKIRINYSIPSIIFTLFNVGFMLWYKFFEPGDIFDGNLLLIFGVPIILLLICIISHKNGRLKERAIVANIGAATIEKSRFTKGSSRHRLSFLSGNEKEVEKLKELKEEKEEEIETI